MIAHGGFQRRLFQMASGWKAQTVWGRKTGFFKPSTDNQDKMKRSMFNSDQFPWEREKQETRGINANVVNVASTVEWQNYCSYEKLPLIVAYILRSMSNDVRSWTKTGSITDPEKSEFS